MIDCKDNNNCTSLVVSSTASPWYHCERQAEIGFTLTGISTLFLFVALSVYGFTHGLQMAAHLDNSHEVLGIVTNFTDWIFLKSLDKQILWDELGHINFGENGTPEKKKFMQALSGKDIFLSVFGTSGWSGLPCPVRHLSIPTQSLSLPSSSLLWSNRISFCSFSFLSDGGLGICFFCSLRECYCLSGVFLSFSIGWGLGICFLFSLWEYYCLSLLFFMVKYIMAWPFHLWQPPTASPPPQPPPSLQPIPPTLSSRVFRSLF